MSRVVICENCWEVTHYSNNQEILGVCPVCEGVPHLSNDQQPTELYINGCIYEEKEQGK